jgi:hypothetical protein
VAVDEHRLRAGGRLSPFADHDRMAFRRVNRCSESYLSERGGDPVGGTRRVGVVLGAGAHARDAEQVEQLLTCAPLVGGEERIEVFCEWHPEKLHGSKAARQAVGRPSASPEEPDALRRDLLRVTPGMPRATRV